MENVFRNVLRKNWFVLGEELAAFEKEYAEYSGTQFSIGVGNGLDALILSLRVLGIGRGDEVIVPSNTYIATVLAVTHVGATPIFVEPRIETYNLNPELLEVAISKKTKAIIPVHLYGQPCEMGSILDIADSYKLHVIEDNAQSHGATWRGRKTGSFGVCNATSFYPGKNMGALGDAGAITTHNSGLADKLVKLRNYGSGKKYYNEVLGFNSRLDELQAAILRVKLRHINKWTAQRVQIASWYNEFLGSYAGIVMPELASEVSHSYHLFVIRSGHRDKLQMKLNEAGIGTLIHYPVPPHLQQAYAYLGYCKGSFPIAEELADTVLSLPLWPGMSQDTVEYISKIVMK